MKTVLWILFESPLIIHVCPFAYIFQSIDFGFHLEDILFDEIILWVLVTCDPKVVTVIYVNE